MPITNFKKRLQFAKELMYLVMLAACQQKYNKIYITGQKIVNGNQAELVDGRLVAEKIIRSVQRNLTIDCRQKPSRKLRNKILYQIVGKNRVESIDITDGRLITEIEHNLYGVI